MSSMKENIQKWIEKSGFSAKYDEKSDFYDIFVRMKNGQYVCRVTWKDAQGGKVGFFECMAIASVPINDKKAMKIVEFVGRVNLITRYSTLLFDTEEGFISCRSSCMSSNPDIWDDRIFDPIFGSTMTHLDSIFPIILELNYSELKPKEAIDKILESQISRESTNESDPMYL